MSAEYFREYRKNNEKYRNYLTEYNKKYSQEHSEELKQYKKEYYIKNKDLLNKRRMENYHKSVACKNEFKRLSKINYSIFLS